VKRTLGGLLIVIALSLASGPRLVAQNLSADRFLDGVAAHPAGDNAELDQGVEVCQSLNAAPPAEVKRVLPLILRYTRSDNGADVRKYATLFLNAIAMRPDGADLLSSGSTEISSLLSDADPGIQKGAVGVTDWVIGKTATNNQPYLAALKTALQSPQTSQDVVLVGMIGPLLDFSSSDPDALKSVMTFLHRDDLTPPARMQLVHELGVVPVPEEVTQYLVARLDDPDARVRAAAVASYADSTTAFHALSRERVERMAKDSDKNPQVRELAKEALAGKTALSPNIDWRPAAPKQP
jgi:hypothetical protein